MRAEHRRPLAAFVLVALACALVVGQSLRTATVQRLVDRGLPLSVLVPIAPDMLFTIDASGDNGRGGDVPYVGRAIIAVSHPAPPSRPVTTAVATVPIASPAVPIASPTVVVRTVARSAAGESTRAAGRQHAPPRLASTATSGARTVAPARGTPTLSPGPTKHVPNGGRPAGADRPPGALAPAEPRPSRGGEGDPPPGGARTKHAGRRPRPGTRPQCPRAEAAPDTKQHHKQRAPEAAPQSTTERGAHPSQVL